MSPTLELIARIALIIVIFAALKFKIGTGPKYDEPFEAEKK